MTLEPSEYEDAWTVLVEELVALRQRAGLTQRELGRRLGLPQTVIVRIEKGKRRVDYLELVIICTVCGESVNTFCRRFAEKYRARK